MSVVMVSFGQTLEYRHVSVDTGLAKSLTLIAVGTAFFFLPPFLFLFQTFTVKRFLFTIFIIIVLW